MTLEHPKRRRRAPPRALRHWHVRRDDTERCWLSADRAGGSTNTLTAAMLEELESVLSQLEREPPAALVIRSAKSRGFIAGADVHEFVGKDDPTVLAAAIRKVHDLLDRLERLPCPTVAMIHGHCLGGGLELALACRHRVAERDARLGFPEILLGIHPGFGGTVRATRMVPAPRALELMLTGRTISASAAKRLGLIDAVTPARHLEAAARRLADSGPPGRRRRLLVAMANSGLVRPPLAHVLSRRISRKVNRDHYPAPFALIELWRRHGGKRERMLAAEAASVAGLLTGATAQNLVRVFLLRERLRAVGKAAPARTPRVHVVGAGAMGGDIAAWCALQGVTVTLQDRAPALLAPAVERAAALFKKRLADGARVQAARDRLIPDPHGAGLGKADIVIEAVPERIELKQALLREVEAAVRPTTVLASNTSSIPLETLAAGLARPGRLIGLHFFNPLAKMPLVEVVRGRASEQAAIETGIALVHRIDRLPLPVRSSPGFLVNRVLAPYLLEAVLMTEEAISPARIDAAARAFGMPVGPLELADNVGLDICLDTATFLTREFGGNAPAGLREAVERGDLGRKSGRGFYRYDKGKPVRAKAAGEADREIEDRLILQLLNACVACLDEGVVEDAELIDAGLVFGAGFAPFRGGPMRFLETASRDALRARLEALERRFGQRFRPSPGWHRAAPPPESER